MSAVKSEAVSMVDHGWSGLGEHEPNSIPGHDEEEDDDHDDTQDLMQQVFGTAAIDTKPKKLASATPAGAFDLGRAPQRVPPFPTQVRSLAFQ